MARPRGSFPPTPSGGGRERRWVLLVGLAAAVVLAGAGLLAGPAVLAVTRTVGGGPDTPDAPPAAEEAPSRSGEPLGPEATEILRRMPGYSVEAPPPFLVRYDYRGERVYFVPAVGGRDLMSRLYDARGDLICRPDGGIDGRGDGRCPDFFDARTNRRDLLLEGPSPTPRRPSR